MAERRFVWDLLKELDNYVAGSVWEKIKDCTVFSATFILAEGTRPDLVYLVRDKVEDYLNGHQERATMFGLAVHVSMVDVFWPYLRPWLASVFEADRMGFVEKYKSFLESEYNMDGRRGPRTLIITRCLLAHPEIIEDAAEDALGCFREVRVPSKTRLGHGDAPAFLRILSVLPRGIELFSEQLHRGLLEGLPSWFQSLTTQDTSRPYYVDLARWIEGSKRRITIFCPKLKWLGGARIVTELDVGRILGTSRQARNLRLAAIRCSNCQRYDAKGHHYQSNAKGYYCPSLDELSGKVKPASPFGPTPRGVHRRIGTRRDRRIWRILRRR